MLVEDDHALTDPPTLSLTKKMLIEFFDLEGVNNATTATEASGDSEEPSTGKLVSPEQTTVEVEAKFSADNLDKVKVRCCRVSRAVVMIDLVFAAD